MIKVNNKVKNIYYMLCYSFHGERLNEKSEELGAEAFDNIYNLFSLLLCLLLKRQIKTGVSKDYTNFIDEISVIKGKINVSNTINRGSLLKKKIVCEFDEYNENILMNQVIKTTIYYLLKSKEVEKDTKRALKKLSLYFDKVDIVNINSIKWDQIIFNRNNISYKNVIDLCKLILQGLIVSDKKGNTKFKEFLDDKRISAIYENFIKEYYRKHFKEFNVSSQKLSLTKKEEYIPLMMTDITLEYEGRMLIIDAKFYSKILKGNRFDDKCKTIDNNHLYQILAYVDNKDPFKKGNVYGMLLYAQTIDEPSISIVAELNMHKIIIKALDMNEDWDRIDSRLKSIAECFKKDKF